MTKERQQKMEKVLANRQNNMTVVLENGTRPFLINFRAENICIRFIQVHNGRSEFILCSKLFNFRIIFLEIKAH